MRTASYPYDEPDARTALAGLPAAIVNSVLPSMSCWDWGACCSTGRECPC